MSEPALQEEPKKRGRPAKSPWLSEAHYRRAFYINCQPQRAPGVAEMECRDSYNKVMTDPEVKSDEQRAFILESVATNCGAAQGITNLIRNAKAYWILLNG